ncbi:MAG: ECF transporter S component [Firmicutes bacterium]|nr:ECF transporter S component [Bacillota bacterium]
MKNTSQAVNIVMTALMIAIITISIMFIKIPIPGTQGYVHLGDAMIFLSVLVLGWRYGAVAAAIGGALGDLMGGAALWAPWTFAIKAIMAIIMGLFIAGTMKKKPFTIGGVPLMELIGMILAGIVMVIGYYIAEGVMIGNWISPMLGVPWNIGQFVVGMVITGILAAALYKTSAKRYFAYRLDEVK